MNPSAIQAALRSRGLQQKDLAEKLGVTQAAISHEINGRYRSDRIRRGIARAIGRSPRVVFPGCYRKTWKQSLSRLLRLTG